MLRKPCACACYQSRGTSPVKHLERGFWETLEWRWWEKSNLKTKLVAKETWSRKTLEALSSRPALWTAECLENGDSIVDCCAWMLFPTGVLTLRGKRNVDSYNQRGIKFNEQNCWQVPVFRLIVVEGRRHCKCPAGPSLAPSKQSQVLKLGFEPRHIFLNPKPVFYLYCLSTDEISVMSS